MNPSQAAAAAGLSCYGLVLETAVASNFSHVQLFNPAASGIVVRVNRVMLRSASAGLIFGEIFGTALTDAAGDSERSDGSSAAVIAQLNRQNDVSQLVVARLAVAGDGVLFSNLNLVDTPVYLPEGAGLTFESAVVNVTLHAAYFWDELEAA